MARVDSQFDLEVAFLSALVQKPSDNPPGDCADHAEMAAKWLEQMGFKVVIFLAVFVGLLFLIKRRIWAGVKDASGTAGIGAMPLMDPKPRT